MEVNVKGSAPGEFDALDAKGMLRTLLLVAVTSLATCLVEYVDRIDLGNTKLIAVPVLTALADGCRRLLKNNQRIEVSDGSGI